MNLYSPTGKKLESWPQWVTRLINENNKLREKIAQLKKQLAEKKDG